MLVRLKKAARRSDTVENRLAKSEAQANIKNPRK